jgi:hypothetical protein
MKGLGQLVAIWVWLSMGGQALQAAEMGISLAIRCDKPEPKIGDPIPIEFIITNHRTNDYEYADRTYDRSGRMPEFALTTRRGSDETLPDPRKGDIGLGGGLYTRATLHPGQSFTRNIDLNLWSDLRTPGKYTVTGKYSGESSVEAASAPIFINVLPRSEREMEDYIRGLTSRIPAGQAPAEGQVRALMYTRDARAAPALIEALYAGGNSTFWASQGLIDYIPHSPEVRREMIEVAEQRGLGGSMEHVLGKYGCTTEEMKPLITRSLAAESPRTWRAGAAGAQHFADDSFAPRLIAIALDPKTDAREEAILALASNRTDESVKALHLLLNDSDMGIRRKTRSAIRMAYLYRGIWKGKLLKPEDFDDSFRAPDPP